MNYDNARFVEITGDYVHYFAHDFPHYEIHQSILEFSVHAMTLKELIAITNFLTSFNKNRSNFIHGALESLHNVNDGRLQSLSRGGFDHW